MDGAPPRRAPPIPPALLGGAALCCLVVSLLCVNANLLLHYGDAVQYVSLGQNLAAGHGYRSDTLRFPDLMQPPLYPLLMAALLRLGLVSSAVTAAVAVCSAAQVLTLWGLLRVHLLWLGPRGLGVTAAIACVYPNLGFGGALVLEPTFLCTLIWSLYFLLSGLGTGQIWRLLLAGLGLGLALLVRPEVVLTAAMAVLLVLVWPWPLPRRIAGLAALFVAAAVVVVPYGLWMRARLGDFEVLPKVRYNLPFADITAHMDWGADQADLGGREQRTFFTLMPDASTFVMNHAFAHRDFDPRPQFPRTQDQASRPGPGILRQLLRSAVGVAVDAAARARALHPLAVVLLLVGVWTGLRGRDPSPWRALRDPDRLVTVALLGLVAGHLLPAVASGADYTSRYLAASLLFSVPLVVRGLIDLSDWLSDSLARRTGRADARAILLGLSVLLVGGYASGTSKVSRGDARVMARGRALERAVAQVVPAGARVTEEHGRATYLAGGQPYQLPYLRDVDELRRYLKRHGIRYAIFDTRTLRKNPSAVNRGLVDRRAWPAELELVQELFPDDEPIRIVRVN